MELEFTPEQRRFRDELRAYFAKMMTDEPSARGRRRTSKVADRSSARPCSRWAATGCSASAGPRKYGGQGRSPSSSSSSPTRSRRVGFPLPFLTLNTVGPVLQQLRQRSAATGSSCRGSSPARSSSRSATPSPTPAPISRRSRRGAVRDGDEWVINGQKMWTSLADTPTTSGSRRAPIPRPRSTAASRCSWCPTTAKGFSRQPIRTVGGVTTNATFYDDVRVPAENLIGGENNGWRADHQAAQPRAHLAHDRRARCAATSKRSPSGRDTPCVDGQRVIDTPGCSRISPASTPRCRSCA